MSLSSTELTALLLRKALTGFTVADIEASVSSRKRIREYANKLGLLSALRPDNGHMAYFASAKVRAVYMNEIGRTLSTFNVRQAQPRNTNAYTAAVPSKRS